MTKNSKNPNLFEEAAAQDQAAVPVDKLELVQSLATKQLLLENRQKELEADLERVKKEWLQVAQIDLPEAMDSVGTGITQLRLRDGFEVVVKEDVAASISATKREAAHQWLEDHDFGDLIKRELKALLPREQADQVEALRAAFDELKISYDEKDSVHASTLKAFVKEQLRKAAEAAAVEKGQPKREVPELPRDLFGIFEYRRAKIVAPKR